MCVCMCTYMSVRLMDFQFHFLCTRFVHQGSRWDWAFTAGSEIGLVLLDSQLHLNALRQRESGSYIKGFDMWQRDMLDIRGSWEHPLTADTYMSKLMPRSSLRLTVRRGMPLWLTACLIVNKFLSFPSIISLKPCEGWPLIFITWQAPEALN